MKELDNATFVHIYTEPGDVEMGKSEEQVLEYDDDAIIGFMRDEIGVVPVHNGTGDVQVVDGSLGEQANGATYGHGGGSDEDNDVGVQQRLSDNKESDSGCDVT